MRVTIQVLIETGADQAPRTETIGTIERAAERAPTSGLGLFVSETHEILSKLQAVLLREEIAQFIDRVARYMRCRLPLGVKDCKTLVYRTAFGKARLNSPRFYSTCSRCKTPARTQPSFSPLAEQLPERVHPQWLWLQSRYAAAMSFRLAQGFLRDAFPAGRTLAVSSVKRNVRRIGERLDCEAQLGAQACIAARQSWNLTPPDGVPELALQIDAGYLRAAPNPNGARWIGAVVSKLVARPARRGYTHAYAGFPYITCRK